MWNGLQVTPGMSKAMDCFAKKDAEGATAAIAEMEDAGDPETWVCEAKGRLALLTRQWLAAYDYLHMAIHVSRGNVSALTLLSMACYELGFWEECMVHARAAIHQQPSGHVLAWINLGAAHVAMQNNIEGLACFEHAIMSDPTSPDAHQAMGNMLYAFGADDGAIQHFRAAQNYALQKHGEVEWVSAAVAEAAALLRSGQYAEGWKKFENRWRLQTVVAPWRYHGKPLYEGDLEGLRGKRVLIRCEQGFGDSIQFCRYIVPLSKIASHIILETQEELVRLFKCLPAEIFVAPRMENQMLPIPDTSLPPYDFQTSMMSLPLLFGTTAENMPPPVDFLKDGYFQPGYGKIGVCWAGGPRTEEPRANMIDRRRSIPREKIQTLLNEIPGYRSLQKEDLGAADWMATAGIIAGLQLVITVDTAIAHLSASMGIPTWMLNRKDSCWRWQVGATTTPWYPSMRIFNQHRLGDWDAVIEDVIAALKERDAQAP